MTFGGYTQSTEVKNHDQNQCEKKQMILLKRIKIPNLLEKGTRY